MDENIGLIVQISGVALIALLTLFLRRSLKIVALRYWANAWCLLCFGLICLRVTAGESSYFQLLGLYFVTQYLFGFLLAAGCYSLAANERLRSHAEFAVIPFIVFGFILPFFSDDVAFLLNLHSMVMAVFFAASYVILWRTHVRTLGWHVMLIAIGLLTVNCLQVFVVSLIGTAASIPIDLVPSGPLFDFILQNLLGFGTVIILLERVLADVERSNAELTVAHAQLKELVHVDPLTAALNRHAFHGYLRQKGEDEGSVHGCVGFFDVDDLKDINDAYGHPVGDAAIRALVRAIRDVIRAEDLIFRWGGDEFFVLMIGLDSELAGQRMSRIDALLTNISLDGVKKPMTIGVSRAFENFDSLDNLETAIEKADAKMYLEKERRKSMLLLRGVQPARLAGVSKSGLAL
ncbi:MAG: diguanylate cyclase [Acidobacteria bacterium OLB17]|nr:MAG: diguanylate cyclase [Acidobacteria bacterium OLB17]MCZ2390094.1 GGDEF domain-containing protein [Acidobacteriota bacterium]